MEARRLGPLALPATLPRRFVEETFPTGCVHAESAKPRSVITAHGNRRTVMALDQLKVPAVAQSASGLGALAPLGPVPRGRG